MSDSALLATGTGQKGIEVPKLFYTIAAVALACSGSAQAAVQIDQVNMVTVPSGAILTGSSLAYQPNFVPSRLAQMQSVTAGKSGLLTGFDLQLFRHNNAHADLAFDVSLVDGEPGASGPISVVGSRSFVKANLPLTASVVGGNAFHVDVSSLGYTVTAGQKFSILVSMPPRDTGATSPTISGPIWAYGYGIPIGEEGDLAETFLSYSNGFNTLIDSAGVRLVSGADRGFRTYVDVAAVPEPASWALMILGFGVAGAAARRRKVVFA